MKKTMELNLDLESLISDASIRLDFGVFALDLLQHPLAKLWFLAKKETESINQITYLDMLFQTLTPDEQEIVRTTSSDVGVNMAKLKEILLKKGITFYDQGQIFDFSYNMARGGVPYCGRMLMELISRCFADGKGDWALITDYTSPKLLEMIELREVSGRTKEEILKNNKINIATLPNTINKAFASMVAIDGIFDFVGETFPVDGYYIMEIFLESVQSFLLDGRRL